MTALMDEDALAMALGETIEDIGFDDDGDIFINLGNGMTLWALPSDEEDGLMAILAGGSGMH